MLLSLLFALTAFSAPNAQDPAWRALLHFPASGGSSSAEPRSAFFLSPEGFRDPGAELAATTKYFDEQPIEAACRFPARAIYLGRPEPPPDGAAPSSSWCSRWAKWRDAIHAKGAELVFAAAFLSSPSSMYGHTLLKFVRGGQSEGEDLLDYTLNYGADTGAVVGLPYVWMGLTGGFDGSYATAPFYLKVKEYNFVENRDFWLYPLKLSEGELRLLVAHAWELREVGFPYFFLHRNCAFYVLELLEVARPGSSFTARFPFWTVPMDTIRLLQEAGLAGAPRLRASRYRRLKALREALQPGEHALVEGLAERGSAALPAGREALLLDAAYELWRYRTEGKGTGRPAIEAMLLEARARYAEPPLRPALAEEAPEAGHPTTRVSAAAGLDSRAGFVELGYRGKLHDLLADPRGYEDYSELSMGDIRARAESGRVFLERLDVLRLRSIAPREEWIPRAAWSFRGGFERAKEFSCTAWGCSAGELEGGYGAGTSLGPVVGFLQAGLGFEVGKPFDRGWRLGAGPAAGLYAPLWPQARGILEGEWRWRLGGSHVPLRIARFGLAQTFTRRWEARVAAEASRAYREGLAQLAFYF